MGRTALRLGFDDAHMSVKVHQRLLGAMPEGVELVAAGGLVERLRAVKDPDEVERIRQAAALTDSVLEWLVDRGIVGRTEREIAIELEHDLRLRRATAPTFPTLPAAARPPPPP